MSSPSVTITDLIEAQVARTPDALAIGAPGRESLTYRRLHEQLAATAEMLAAMGIGRDDCVAIVLPSGPELATAVLAITMVGVSAPLNPEYTAREVISHFERLRPTALLAQSGSSADALDVARSRGCRVIELHPILNGAAGLFSLSGFSLSGFSLSGEERESGTPLLRAQAADVAMVLPTSGTTARPKIVPLTHTNLCAAATNIQTVLRLDSRESCLNVMPLFHIHGFSALLSTLISGGQAICAPGFFATRFFDWMDEFHPTWYTAAPTIHQAILARASAHRTIIERRPLRFIRSASSGLPLGVLAELERVFGVPVIEAYGMTEAAPQISSNPLPPGVRKPGSVGRPAGPEVAVLDEEGHPLPVEAEGEVVIRGANVTPGYKDDADAGEAQTSAMWDGWLRTGDLGYLDAEGYLYITGRIKEMINRGGEKIAPREVEEILLSHPAVAEAVSFAVPQAELGEEVGAAVVLRAGAEATAPEIRSFLAERMVYFKVPAHLLIMPELPKGATAKLQRRGLAERLGLQPAPARAPVALAGGTAPRSSLERELAAIWGEVLAVEGAGVEQSFFELGGDSMLATLVISRMRQAWGIELSIADLFEAPTIAALAARIEEVLADEGRSALDLPAVEGADC